jgi:hypothetical protein
MDEDTFAYRCVGVCTPDLKTGCCVGCGRPMDALELSYFAAPSAAPTFQGTLPPKSDAERGS